MPSSSTPSSTRRGDAHAHASPGSASLCDTISRTTVPFVVWLNPYHGVIDYEGKGFTDTKVLQGKQGARRRHRPDPRREERTPFGIDIENMLKARRHPSEKNSSRRKESS